MRAPFRPEATLRQRLLDHLLFPLNVWLGEDASSRLGLTPIDHERIRIALRHCRGRLLDVACGNNLLVREHGNGYGVDVHPYPEVNVLCESDRLPFSNSTFDTVALIACLNHIIRREETLAECRRVLRDEGALLVTMIPSWVGFFSHPIRKRHDPDQLDRGMSREEEWGLSSRRIARLLVASGFQVALHQRFTWGLNNLFVARKSVAPGQQPQALT
jgi:SAM-dependent methyltransferase